MRRVVFNRKGGVGKSTIACNLAAISAARGRDTILLDLDPQGNSSRYLLGDGVDQPGPDGAGFFGQMLEFTFHDEPLASFLRPTRYPGLRVLCASSRLDEMESKLESRYKMMKLREALERVPDETVIYIDTPPALDFFSRSALIASNGVLVPFDCDDFSRRALYNLLDAIREIQADHNRSLILEGIVVNQYHSRAKLPRQLVDELKAEGLPVLNTFISSSIKIRESHTQARPMIHLDPSHKLSGELMALYDALDHAQAGGPDAIWSHWLSQST